MLFRSIPDSVTSIGDAAFSSCTGLTEVFIPKNVTSIGYAVFAGCTGVESISVDEGNKYYYSEGNCLIEKASERLVASCKNSVIPNGIRIIGNRALAGWIEGDFVIPDSVVRIEEFAFMSCHNLRKIVIPSSVKSIGRRAFYNCTDIDIIYCGTEDEWIELEMNSLMWNEGLSYNLSFHNLEFVSVDDKIHGDVCAECGDVFDSAEHKFVYALHNEDQHSATCSCGEVQYHDHAWNDGDVVSAATHLADGTKLFECGLCGETKTEAIPKLESHNHIFSEKHNGAQHKLLCFCGDAIYENHVWDSGVVILNATHTNEGIKLFTCACGETKTETLAKTSAHAWSEGVVISEASHTHEGIKLFTCACGETMSEKTEKTKIHSYDILEEHDGDQHKKSCACGDETYSAHTWGNGVISTQATFDAEGVKTYTCTGCGATKTETVAKLPMITLGATDSEGGTKSGSNTEGCNGVISIGAVFTAALAGAAAVLAKKKED